MANVYKFHELVILKCTQYGKLKVRNALIVVILKKNLLFIQQLSTNIMWTLEFNNLYFVKRNKISL